LVNGAVARRYTYGLQRISESQVVNSAWTASFYQYDGRGTVRMLTNSAGAVNHLDVKRLDDLPDDSTVTLLRAHLFFEQRRWNHYGRQPDEEALKAIRRVLALIRQRLSESGVCPKETAC
jgi:hypothetical protein